MKTMEVSYKTPGNNSATMENTNASTFHNDTLQEQGQQQQNKQYENQHQLKNYSISCCTNNYKLKRIPGNSTSCSSSSIRHSTVGQNHRLLGMIVTTVLVLMQSSLYIVVEGDPISSNKSINEDVLLDSSNYKVKFASIAAVGKKLLMTTSTEKLQIEQMDKSNIDRKLQLFGFDPTDISITYAPTISPSASSQPVISQKPSTSFQPTTTRYPSVSTTSVPVSPSSTDTGTVDGFPSISYMPVVSLTPVSPIGEGETLVPTIPLPADIAFLPSQTPIIGGGDSNSFGDDNPTDAPIPIFLDGTGPPTDVPSPSNNNGEDLIPTDITPPDDGQQQENEFQKPSPTSSYTSPNINNDNDNSPSSIGTFFIVAIVSCIIIVSLVLYRRFTGMRYQHGGTSRRGYGRGYPSFDDMDYDSAERSLELTSNNPGGNNNNNSSSSFSTRSSSANGRRRYDDDNGLI
jgi:hypothetical protein